MLTLLIGWLLGLAVGLRHALEPDHLAAVSTLIATEKRAPRAALLGASWGLGHTAAILAAGGALVLLQAALPDRLGDLFEMLVACVLLALGARALLLAARLGRSGVPSVHRHGGHEHLHAGPTAHVHLGPWTLARRPFLIGLVHGLAGSGAVAAFALASQPSPGARIVYLALFGLGSVGGMAALTWLAGRGLAKLAQARRAQPISLWVSGALSLIVGVAHGWAPAARLFQ